MNKVEYNLLQPSSCAFRDVHIVLIAYLKYIKKEKIYIIRMGIISLCYLTLNSEVSILRHLK
jgi:hypothetical protein